MLHQLLPATRWDEVISPEFWTRDDVATLRNDEVRASLEQKLAEQIGEVHAATILAYVPPIPWAELRARGVQLPTRADLSGCRV